MDREHYFSTEYNSKKRWTSFAQQYQLVQAVVDEQSEILEVGPGTKAVTHTLREAGHEVTTVDVAHDLEPDVIGDVRDLPFRDNQFDVVCAFEVLEHIPFEDVGTALGELRRVAEKSVLISLPYARMTFEASLKVPMISEKHFCLNFPAYRLFEYEFDGEHYWEVGKKGVGRRTVEALMAEFMRICRVVENPYNTYHLFYRLEVASCE